ncbi:hypothetical protein LCGC14_1269260 [marine sediment metagenome]|uniref:Uncharacterized protein n=1 Tax=marine sediment metagenome TaxID=412755 RepID=A0A0F9P1P4_9ZZZZ|nr:hypothetical protein [bacterium]
MSKALTKPEEDEALKEWKKSNSPQSAKYNQIKLDNIKFNSETEKKNPNFGKIFAYNYDGDEEVVEEMKIGDSFFPVLTRVQISCRDYVKSPDSKREGAKYWCRETDSGEDIELFDMSGDTVFAGRYKDAKEEYNLKYQVVIYALFNEKMYRWKVGGESLSAWFDVVNQITDLGFPHSVKIENVVAQKNKAGIHWNNIYFEVDEKFELKRYMELKKKIEDALNSYYDKQKEKKTAEENTAELADVHEPPPFLKE